MQRQVLDFLFGETTRITCGTSECLLASYGPGG